MSEKDEGNLLAIVDCCSKIEKFIALQSNADTFFEDQKTFDAVLMNLIVIGESVARISEDTKVRESQIPWLKIKGLRNIVAHDYFGVDAEEIWQIIKTNLPEFERELIQLLKTR